MVLLVFPAAFSHSLRQEMVFQSEEILHVEVELERVDTPNVTLEWPFSLDDLLGEPVPSLGVERLELRQEGLLGISVTPASGAPKVVFSITLRFPIRSGGRYTFAFPASDSTYHNRTLQLLLPIGWSGTNLSAGGEKRYDPGTGRIRLIWRDAIQQPEAVLAIPGMGQGELAREVIWRLVARDILYIVLAAVAAAAFLLLLRSR